MSELTLERPDLSAISDADIFAAAEARKNKLQENRTAYKELVLEAVPKAVFELCYVSELLSKAKQRCFERFEQILTLKNEVYGIKEKQRSHTFSSDNAEIIIGYRINDGWDDSHTAGIEKVKNVLTSLAKDENSAILVDTIFDLLKKDAKGNLKGSRVLELQKLAEKINNPELTDGVNIIAAAYKPVRSSWFIEAYTITEGKSKISVPLAMSSVDFPATYSFDFFNEPIIENNGSTN